MDASTSDPLDVLLNTVVSDGLIDRYETGATRVTFYQGAATYSLARETARDFLQRVVRASGDAPPASGLYERG